MLKNTLINLKSIKIISDVLDDINNDVIYVGGAVVSLYIDDPAADDIRPTKDIDIVLEIASLKELEELRTVLVERGFEQTHEDNVLCRFRYADIKVDVMATKSIDWAPGNKWFEAGFNEAEEKEIEGKIIKVLPFIYFLSSKFSAFMDRGLEDPLVSKDYEDITYLLNHNRYFKEAVLSSKNEEAKSYLKSCFQKILDREDLQEILIGNLFHEDQQARFDKIISNLKEIVNDTP